MLCQYGACLGLRRVQPTSELLGAACSVDDMPQSDVQCGASFGGGASASFGGCTSTETETLKIATLALEELAPRAQTCAKCSCSACRPYCCGNTALPASAVFSFRVVNEELSALKECIGRRVVECIGRRVVLWLRCVRTWTVSGRKSYLSVWLVL